MENTNEIVRSYEDVLTDLIYASELVLKTWDTNPEDKIDLKSTVQAMVFLSHASMLAKAYLRKAKQTNEVTK